MAKSPPLSSKMRARDVRDRVFNKCDPQVQYVLEALAEQHTVHQQQLTEFALMLDQMTDILNSVVEVGAKMKGAVDMLTQKDPEDDLPPVTQ